MTWATCRGGQFNGRVEHRSADVRFVGEICGFGTTSGRRIVIGRWPTSPFGPIADAMVEAGDGHRTLIAPTDEVADYISGVYLFDELIVAAIATSRSTDGLHFEGGPLVAAVTIGGRDALGRVLRVVPRRFATHPRWASICDPIARRLLGGVRTRGQTAGGEEFYGATDRHRLVAARASWSAVDLGPLADVDPPVRFGFSSTPRRPSIVAVTTTIRPLASGSGETSPPPPARAFDLGADVPDSENERAQKP